MVHAKCITCSANEPDGKTAPILTGSEQQAFALFSFVSLKGATNKYLFQDLAQTLTIYWIVEKWRGIGIFLCNHSKIYFYGSKCFEL